MKKITVTALTCSIFLLFIFGTIVAGAEVTWTTQTVDSSGEVRDHPSIALDSSGNPHIAYAVTDGLKYASWDGKTWNSQNVDIGVNPYLVLDSSGVPHIIYIGVDKTGGLNILKYAVKTNSGWNIQKVDQTDASSYNSLALDSQGNPHISYFFSDGRTYGFLKYASGSSSGWSIKDVEQAGNYGDACSLALDKTGNPNISYYYKDSSSKFGSYFLKYAKWTDTSWQMQTLAEIGVTLTPSTCIALDTNGNPHITYNVNDNLKYASWTNKEWNIQDLGFGVKSSLVLDKAGNPHISYSGLNSQIYASWAGSKWDIQTIKQTSNGESSLALDSNVNPHICYIASTYTGQQSYRNNLMYTFALMPQTGTATPTIIAFLFVLTVVAVVLAVLLLLRKRRVGKSKINS
jgi:LPXTG-motif cell wall-anchored protein